MLLASGPVDCDLAVALVAQVPIILVGTSYEMLLDLTLYRQNNLYMRKRLRKT